MGHMVAILPSFTKQKCLLFGKNSYRPAQEIPSIRHLAELDYVETDTIKCSNLSIKQVSHTHAAVLCQSSDTWGAEMGTNQHGVCIGCNLICTKNQKDENLDGLLGTDIVRLGLERSTSCVEALDIITSLIEKYTMAVTTTSTGNKTASYSFILADGDECWILDVADNIWAAKKCTDNIIYVFDQPTIQTSMDKCSTNLKDVAKSKGWWDSGEFNFKEVFSAKDETCSISSDHSVAHVLEDGMEPKDLMNLLREFSEKNKESSTSVQDWSCINSQVSALVPRDSSSYSCHWFTGTPNAKMSMYKPLFFVPDITLGQGIVCDNSEEVGAHSTECHGHCLYRKHQNLIKLIEDGIPKGTVILDQMMDLERLCCEDINTMATKEQNLKKMSEIFKHMCEIEIGFY